MIDDDKFEQSFKNDQKIYCYFLFIEIRSNHKQFVNF